MWGSRQASLIPQDWASTRPVALISAVMAALAMLALIGFDLAGRQAQQWNHDLHGALTVVVTDVGGADGEAAFAAVLTTLKGIEGVQAVTPIPPQAVRTALAPWIGGDPAIPLPRLAEVRLDPDVPADMSARVAASLDGLGASVTDHGAFLAPVNEAARQLRLLALVALCAALLASAAAVVLACRAALAAQAGVIEVLRLVGAEDRFICRQFAWRHGLAAALGALPGALGLWLLPKAVFSMMGHGIWLALVPPVLLTAVALLAAWFVVGRALQRMEGWQ